MTTLPHLTRFGSRHAGSARAYQQLGVESSIMSATPHRLVALLLEGAVDRLAEARGALARTDVEAKGRLIGQAARIVEEGLRAALDPKAGGELAGHLDALYRYVNQRLTHANLHNDDAALQECAGLLAGLRDTWAAIEPAAAPAAARTPA